MDSQSNSKTAPAVSIRPDLDASQSAQNCAGRLPDISRLVVSEIEDNVDELYFMTSLMADCFDDLMIGNRVGEQFTVEMPFWEFSRLAFLVSDVAGRSGSLKTQVEAAMGRGA